MPALDKVTKTEEKVAGIEMVDRNALNQANLAQMTIELKGLRKGQCCGAFDTV